MPAELSRHELDFVALRYFDQLGHDNQHRIFKFFAWEPPKSNGSYGGYGDYPKATSAKLDTMTTAELGKFLMVCALASDLYCPAYNSGAALPKDAKLAKEAAYYKVNSDRILWELKEKRIGKSARPKKSKPQATAKPAAKAKTR